MSSAAADMSEQAWRDQAQNDAWSMPLEQINVADPLLFKHDAMWPYFERLRKEDPVHYCPEHEFGPYWSITKYKDIMAVDTNHQVFSSEPSITIVDPQEDFRLPMFIAMDPPKHDAQRKVVTPAVSPLNLENLAPIIRERAGKILDSLPRGEVIDWVDLVSIELTTMTLATLFDFPWEDRRKLTYWSDMATAGPHSPLFVSQEHRREQLYECVDYFMRLWNERVNADPRPDLISMLAHGESTRNMDRMEYLGNLILLIVGGNDTTRNTISGSILALNQNPDQYKKLRDNPDLIPSMVSETIRWQTPLAHMRRTAKEDIEFGGKTDQEGRQGHHVVRLGQPRRRGDRKSERLHHRSRAFAPASVLRLRHPSLRWQQAGGTATQDHLGRDPGPLPGHRAGGRAGAHGLQLRQGL